LGPESPVQVVSRLMVNRLTHKSIAAAAGTVRQILNFDGFMFFSIAGKEKREK
jgi:hypothetical protein